MKILHYTLGLPPFRSGGSSKSSSGLMKAESDIGHSVFLLYPGRYSIDRKARPVKDKVWQGVDVYELVNPLPVPLLGGIKEPGKFMKKTDVETFKRFLAKIGPDVIHIHTLMGLYAEFLEAAVQLGIRTVYSTRDYFGICMKVNLVNFENEVCCGEIDINKCAVCNSNGYSQKLIYLMQSKTYRYFKDSMWVKRFRSRKKEDISKKEGLISHNHIKPGAELVSGYEKLLSYYSSMMSKISYFHYNSTVCRDIFEKQFGSCGRVINITHKGISDNRRKKEYNAEKLRLGFSGSLEAYKGFGLVKDALDILEKRGVNMWELHIYGNNQVLSLDKEHYIFHGRYSQENLPEVFSSMDILLLPSICFETFGLIGLEAISHGVPVIVTERVGLKDILENGKYGLIVKVDSVALADCIEGLVLDKKKLQRLNENIINGNFCFNINEHARQMVELYHENHILRR